MRFVQAYYSGDEVRKRVQIVKPIPGRGDIELKFDIKATTSVSHLSRVEIQVQITHKLRSDEQRADL